MPVSFHEWNGTLVSNTTAAVSYLDFAVLGGTPGYAMTAADADANGTDVTYKVDGLVKGVTKTTATAFVVGDKLKVSTAGAWSKTTTSVFDGFAHAPATAAATTADVVLAPGPAA